MGHKVTKFEPTPNPDAVKCVIDPALSGPNGDSLRSYRTPAQAADDPLASRLMAIPGVSALLINPRFITVNKAPDASWSDIRAAVEKTLAQT